MIELKMTDEELAALPVSVDLETAGRAFGMGRTKAFDLAKRGEFPCKVLKVGAKYRVPKRALLEALDFEDAASDPREDAASDPREAA